MYHEKPTPCVTCASCGKTFNQAKALAFHNIRKHGDSWAVLDQIDCGVSEDDVNVIYDKCTRGKKYFNKVEEDKDTRISLQTVPEGVLTIRCEDCNSDIQEAEVRDHIQKNHRYDGMTKCYFCLTDLSCSSA